MKRLLLLSLPIVVLGSCTKINNDVVTRSLPGNSPNNINAVFTMASHEDSLLLQEAKHYRQILNLYDINKQHFITISVSSDELSSFNSAMDRIKSLELLPVYSNEPDPSLARNNSSSSIQSADESLSNIEDSKKITIIVIATQLPNDAKGFRLSPRSVLRLKSAIASEGSITPISPYTHGYEFVTLTNGIRTYNTGLKNIFVVRSYKKTWLSSWSSWGNATVTSGNHDNYCIKDKNRIRIQIHFYEGTGGGIGGSPTPWAVEFYGSSTCP